MENFNKCFIYPISQEDVINKIIEVLPIMMTNIFTRIENIEKLNHSNQEKADKYNKLQALANELGYKIEKNNGEYRCKD